MSALPPHHPDNPSHSLDPLRLALRSLAAFALVAAVAQAYLTINKLWIRKHEPAVAESVSIMGEALGLLTLGALTLTFVLNGAWEGVVDGVIWMAAGAFTIAIGTGMWVEGKRKRGFWTLLREALRVEKSEVGDLARSFFRPSGARQILDILGQVALIDRHLDARERAFIESFADAWGIDFSWDELEAAATGGHFDFVRLREAVAEYLRTTPPPAQVTQLGDVLTALVAIDEETTSEEELMLEELHGMLTAYVDRDGAGAGWGVAIVPQDPGQDAAIASLLPDVGKRELEGGIAYLLGPYHSHRYADLVGDQYRSLHFFTTVVRAPREDAPREETRV